MKRGIIRINSFLVFSYICIQSVRIMLWIKINELFSSVFFGGYESPFSQEEITPVLNTFLKKAEKQSFKGVVKGASLKVYVSGTHIIGMDYSLPVMEYGKPSELLKIPDRIQYSGSQSVSEVEDVPDFYFRVQEGLVVPFYMDGVAACREGVVREEEEINGGGIRFPTQLFRNSSWVYMIYPLLTEIPRWKKFTRLVDSQANIDLLIFLTNGEVYWNLWDKENSYLDGERGVTYFVENIQDFKKQQLEEDNLKDVQEKYLDSSFQKDKKCVLVGLASDMFRQIEITKTDILDKKISINQIEQLCISILNTILHECLAHATDYIVNGKNTTTVFQEHESYSGAKSVSTYSDKTYFQNTALHNTSEYKTLIEIKGVVEWFFKDTDFLVEMINDLE
ncbi:MAG: hypothetical protein K1X92_18890 [Bacteroidia bacterium]|nr:hypothetical protein [Bacteroidia bacterium]